MILWLCVNSISILVIGGVLYLTMRQVGILLNQIGPVGARQSSEGPRVGENILRHVASELPGAVTDELPALYVFGSESCAICKSVRRSLETLAPYWAGRAAMHLVYDAAPRVAEDRSHPRALRFWVTRKLRDKLDVKALPFAVMTDAHGDVLAKGLVNDISHVESLLERAMPVSLRKEAPQEAIHSSGKPDRSQDGSDLEDRGERM
jgi:methylamine dehydrogenase accessory protein MauD